MKLLFLIKEGISGFRRARLASAITVVSVTLSLMLVGLFGLFVHQASDLFERNFLSIRLEAYAAPTLPEEQIRPLQQSLASIEGIASVEYISPEAALTVFKQDFGMDLVEALQNNPLDPSFRITIHSDYSDMEKIQAIAEAASKKDYITEVVYEENLVQLMSEYFYIGLAVAIVTGALIFLISTLLIFNTIRLTIHSRRNVIEIMKLVGATRNFIKAPFIIEGVLQGLLGSLLAVAGIWLLSQSINWFFLKDLAVPGILFAMLILSGIILGLFGSYISVGKYLRI